MSDVASPYSEMSQLSFDHLLNLSFAWHTHRKTGEILRVLDRGAAINHTLEVSLDTKVYRDADSEFGFS
jgi:ABC-type transport system involved in Fe-S cluster assembly fused permease/ATPase subunit